MSNYSSGHHAEQVAAKHLEKLGYRVCAINWKAKLAEIDIIAERSGGDGIVFFEVKHRKTTRHGFGLDYITPAKLNQMQFAAQLWVVAHGYKGEYSLGAIELSGDAYEITSVLDSLF